MTPLGLGRVVNGNANVLTENTPHIGNRVDSVRDRNVNGNANLMLGIVLNIGNRSVFHDPAGVR